MILAFLAWAMQPENFREAKQKIESYIYGINMKDSYNAKSLLLVDLSNNENFMSKNLKEKELPASLAKLFVIEYATTLTDLDDIVKVNQEALSLTKQGSSVANIKAKKY